MKRSRALAVKSKVEVSHEGRAETGNFFYGWTILFVSTAALIATSPGQTFGVSIFNEHIRCSLGLTHSQLAAAYMLGTLLAALPLTGVGALMDRYGPRRALIATVGLFGLACIGTSLVSGWISLFLSFFMLRLLGPGTLSFVSGNALAFWFHRRLGTAEGLRQLGYAVALIVIPIVYLWLVQRLGWRASYAVLGVAIWGVMLPLVMGLICDRPDQIGQALDGAPLDSDEATGPSAASDQWGFALAEAFRSAAGWIVAAGTAAYALVHTAVFFHLVAICRERGLNDTTAAAVLSMFAMSLAIALPLGGVLADRLPANVLLAAGMAGLGLSMLALLTVSAVWSAQVAGATLGASQGIYFAASNPLWARYFGLRHIGKIRGMLATLNVGASSAGPLVAGLSRDCLGSFTPALVAFAVLPLPLAVLSLLVKCPVPPRSLCEDQLSGSSRQAVPA